MENMFHSTKPANALPCGHTMHVHCMQECFQKNQTSCPLCRKTMLSPDAWTKQNEMMDEFIRRFPMQEELMFSVLCNDCGFNGDACYHPYGMKCGGCGGYNTMRN
jgi:hypothetical protein